MRAQAKGTTETPLLEETIGERLEASARRHAQRKALVMPHQDVRWTYERLNREVDRVARGFLARGLEKGDRLGIWAPNLAEWVLVQLATAKLGVILVNINPAYRAPELAYALAQSGCRMLVAARRFKSSDYVQMLAEVRGGCAALEDAIFLDEPGGAGDWARLLADGERVPAAEIARRMASLAPADPINIQYTSGTTGSPKGATLSHCGVLNNAYFFGRTMRFSEADRLCVPVPFFHVGGMITGILCCLVTGAAIVVPAAAFEPAATLAAITRERCTGLLTVPTMCIAMLAHPDFAATDVTSLRTGAIGGSPCPIELMRRLVGEFHLPEITIIYGMTETSGCAAQTAVDDPLEKRVGSVGRVHPHVEIRILDPDTGEVCARGAPGEFQTRGYSVMLGYWNDAARTREAITDDGWMRTGDLGVMDDAGYVNIVGRLKDMIIRGGENIYPREIEEFLYGHPDVRDVQVVGVPDARFGEEAMAWVILKDGAPPLSLDALHGFCRGRIAHYKIPRYLQLCDEFPTTVSGKVRKVELRERAVKMLGLERVAALKTA